MIRFPLVEVRTSAIFLRHLIYLLDIRKIADIPRYSDHDLAKVSCYLVSIKKGPKPSLKIGTANAICWNSLGLFRDFFVFQDRKFSASVWKRISWKLTKFQLNQTIDRKNENNNCLNELKFCEVSRNSYSNRRWKFQLSIMKNKQKNISKKM